MRMRLLCNLTQTCRGTSKATGCLCLRPSHCVPKPTTCTQLLSTQIFMVFFTFMYIWIRCQHLLCYEKSILLKARNPKEQNWERLTLKLSFVLTRCSYTCGVMRPSTVLTRNLLQTLHLLWIIHHQFSNYHTSSRLGKTLWSLRLVWAEQTLCLTVVTFTFRKFNVFRALHSELRSIKMGKIILQEQDFSMARILFLMKTIQKRSNYNSNSIVKSFHFVW